MRLRKIAFLVSHSSAGGVQELWADIAHTLSEKGHDVRLVALYPGTGLQSQSELPWEYVVSERPRSLWKKAKLIWALIAALRAYKADRIFSAMPAANVLVPVAAKIGRCTTKIVISHHSPTETHNRILDAADSIVGCLSNIETIVGVSNSVRASLRLKPKTYLNKVLTIPNALPPYVEETLNVLARQRVGRKAGRRAIAAGRLSKEKNYPLMIRATALSPNLELHIVGAGPEELALKQLAKTIGASDRIIFHGQLPRKETLRQMASSDLFVQTSFFEGHSLALLEAAKLNIPIIVSEVPAQIEATLAADGTRCALTVGVDDDQALADTIMELLDDEEKYRFWMSKSAALANIHSYTVMIDSYERLLS